jgi:hypothetical protein
MQLLLVFGVEIGSTDKNRDQESRRSLHLKMPDKKLE